MEGERRWRRREETAAAAAVDGGGMARRWIIAGVWLVVEGLEARGVEAGGASRFWWLSCARLKRHVDESDWCT